MLQTAALFVSLLYTSTPTETDTTRVVAGRLFIEPLGVSMAAPPTYSDTDKDLAPLRCQASPRMYITRRGLDSLKVARMNDWDGQLQMVANRTLGSAKLVAQFGEDEWGNGRCFGGLDVRVYTSTAAPDDIIRKILRNGPPLIKSEYAARNEALKDGAWSVAKLQWTKMFGDWGANARMEYYVRSVNGRTVILLLMYDNPNPKALAGVTEVLSSFRIERKR